MYYLAFFLYYPPFLREKLSLFVDRERLDVWIRNFQQESSLVSLESLSPYLDLDSLSLFNGFVCARPWYLHGALLEDYSIQEFPEIPLYHGTSLKKVDDLFRWFAEHYSWAIFPWGAQKNFSSFVFLSTESQLRDTFINCSSNIRDLKVRPTEVDQCNLLISSYDVVANFSEVVKAIVFDEFRNPGKSIWNACECDAAAPWLITESFYDHEDDEVTLPISWEEADFTFVSIFSLFGTTELAIYEALNQESFISMFLVYLCDPDTLLAVPQQTNLDNLKALLRKTESFLYSDLSYLQEILASTGWFYGIGRDFEYYYYSFFVARDSEIIRKIDKFNEDGDYRLISFF